MSISYVVAVLLTNNTWRIRGRKETRAEADVLYSSIAVTDAVYSKVIAKMYDGDKEFELLESEGGHTSAETIKTLKDEDSR